MEALDKKSDNYRNQHAEHSQSVSSFCGLLFGQTSERKNEKKGGEEVDGLDYVFSQIGILDTVVTCQYFVIHLKANRESFYSKNEKLKPAIIIMWDKNSRVNIF